MNIDGFERRLLVLRIHVLQLSFFLSVPYAFALVTPAMRLITCVSLASSAASSATGDGSVSSSTDIQVLYCSLSLEPFPARRAAPETAAKMKSRELRLRLGTSAYRIKTSTPPSLGDQFWPWAPITADPLVCLRP